MPTLRPHALAAIALSALAPIASAQVTLLTATRSVTATAGDGSGTTQFSSAALTDFNHTATKSFPNGQAQAVGVSTSDGWHLTNHITSTSNAASQGQAGSAQASYQVSFNASSSFDMFLGVTTTAGPNSVGTYNFVLFNDTTNQVVFSGLGFQTLHLTAGNYIIVQSNSATWGSFDSTMDIAIHPINDTCANPTTVLNGSTSGDTTHATPDGETSCGGSNQTASIWYRYTAPGTGPLTVTTCWSNFDTILSAYNPAGGCPLDQTDQLACNDDILAGAGYECDNSLQSGITLNVTTGQTIYFRVSGWLGETGHSWLNVGPLNDQRWSPFEIASGETDVFDNRLATTDGPALNQCTNGGLDNQVNGDLWWLFYAPTDGDLSVDTCGSTLDTKLAIYEYTPWPNPLPYLACSDDACGALNASVQNLHVTGPDWYVIRVGGYRTQRGTGVLHANFVRDCPADFNGDGFLDFFDIDAFVDCFETANCPPGKSADFNGDQFVDFFDIDAFVAAFEAGC